MTVELLVELAWKSMLGAGATLAVLAVLRGRSASERSLVAHIGIFSLVLLPLAVLALPALHFTPPEPIAPYMAAKASIASEVEIGNSDASQATALSAPTAPRAEVPAPEEAPQPFAWEEAGVAIYLAICAAFLAGLLIAIVRLQLVRARAELIQDTEWLSALIAAQHRAGFKHGTALLSSAELKSPVSWGLMRPIIIVDETALAQKSRAEAIIAHELAHVTRMDWLRLMLGRVALAFYWFNPLVWMLVRKAHQLSEEAADDAVLRTQVPDCEYAELLLGTVRHAHNPAFLAANGVAPSRSSLGKRIDHVLDPRRARQPARVGWMIGSLALALSFNGLIAAAEPATASIASLPAAPEAKRSVASGERGQVDVGARTTEGVASGPSEVMAEEEGGTAQAAEQRSGSASGALPTQPNSGSFGSDAYVRQLGTMLRDPDAAVRAQAAGALGDLQNPSARPLLEAAGGDPDARVRSEAADALGEIAYAEAILRRFPAPLGSEYQSDGYVQQLGRLLQDPLPSVRIKAAHMLGDLQNPNARPILEAARSDPDRGVRSKVSWALARVAETEDILRRFRAD